MKTVLDWFSFGVHDRAGARSSRALVALTCVTLALSACSSPGPEGNYYDPMESQNRAVHAFNKSLDKALIGPTADAYGEAAPGPVKQAIANVADNLTMPNRLVNNVLQFDLEAATITTLRFASNTIFGLGGLFDIASEFGMPDDDTDFGDTLYTWNVGEGPYVVLPLYGPNTARGAVGLVADIVLLDPLGHFLPDQEDPLRATIWTLDKLGERDQYGDLIDEILYASPDSYVTERSYYLQNRRYRLSKELSESDLEDPYAE